MNYPDPRTVVQFWRRRAKPPDKWVTGRLAEVLQGVLDLTPNAVLLVGEDQTIHFANRSVRNVFGYQISQEIEKENYLSPLVSEIIANDHLHFEASDMYTGNSVDSLPSGQKQVLLLIAEGSSITRLLRSCTLVRLQWNGSD